VRTLERFAGCASVVGVTDVVADEVLADCAAAQAGVIAAARKATEDTKFRSRMLIFTPQ
jgi:hypothetical protein